MVYRTYQYKNGKIKHQQVAGNDVSAYRLKTGTITEEVLIPHELTSAINRWKKLHS